MSYFQTTGITSIANSTATPLNAGISFTGTAEIVEQFSSLTVAVYTDQNGTLQIQCSNDGTNWDAAFTLLVVANTSEQHRLVNVRRYVRTVFTNTSASNQTFLRLQVMYGFQGPVTSLLSGTVGMNADSLVVRPVDPQFEMSAGKYNLYKVAHAQGQNPVINVASTPEDIWNGGGVYTGFPTGAAETVDVFSSSANDTAAGTGARTVRIYGLDASGVLQQEDLTLNGVAHVVSVNTYTRVFKGVVLTAGSGTTNAGTLTCQHTTTVADVFFVMPIGCGESRACVYTIPAGYTGYLQQFGSSMLDSTANTATMCFWVRENGGAVRLLRPFMTSTNFIFEDSVYGGFELPALTDVALRVTAVANNGANITGDFDVILRKN